MNQSRTYVSFDWAMKKLLRQKVNFGVLEGFLSTLLGFEVKIQSILESESNPETSFDKNNKLDILCEDKKQRLIFIEVQYLRQIDFFHRILFGVSKLLTNYIEKGEKYEKLRKVYSINILYFDLGQGKDYLYHGSTQFKGVNQQDKLKLSLYQRNYFGCNDVYELYPEYYILKVNNFNKLATNNLDEWIYFLKNSELPSTYSAPGLKEAGEKLKYQKMSKAEQVKYDKYLETFAVSESEIRTAHYQGREEGKIEMILGAYKKGIPVSEIAEIADRTEIDIKKILVEYGLLQK